MTTTWPYPFWIAHRGAGKLAPENTLAAFRLGAQHGWRMFECDAKLSADGVLFLLHDNTLERTTSGHGVAGKRPWSELAQLDAGRWHSRAYAGETIPTLENLARWCLANHYFLDIEIKPTPGEEERTGQAVAKLTSHLWQNAATPPLLTSFRPESLLGAMKTAPELPRGLLLDTLWDDWADRARQLQCAAVVCNHALWDPALVAQVKAMGMRCLSYTVNDEWAAERLIALGTDGVVSDRVDLFAPG
ncbi:glycerophosphodiester phosphodiesterase [Ottowia sp. VDI28]|uniref:glycerophosphodiester phosphodiesterase n=1 Tax=Ottowia sp. VDI28 TaxID=3133968 RepID=UPI003C2C736B